jgi:hypothetical protein
MTRVAQPQSHVIRLPPHTSMCSSLLGVALLQPLKERAEHLAHHVQLAHRQKLGVGTIGPLQHLDAPQRRRQLRLVVRGGTL